jgi:hypothetical protein
MLGTATVSCPSVFDPFILSRSSSRSSTDRTKAVPHLLLRELRGEVLEKLPPRLEIALHCNEHSRRNVLTAKKAGPVKLPKNKAIHNSASGRASRSTQALEKSPMTPGLEFADGEKARSLDVPQARSQQPQSAYDRDALWDRVARSRQENPVCCSGT